MRIKQFVLQYQPQLLVGIVTVILAALNSSKAGISLGVPTLALLMLLYQGFQGVPLQPWSRRDLYKALILTGIFWIAVISGFQTEGLWLRDIKSKLHFLAIPLGLVFLPRATRRQHLFWSRIFIASQAFWGVLTLIQFALNYETEMLNVAQNGHIDIFGSISHIYYSLLLGFSVILGMHLLSNPANPRPRLIAVLTIFNFVLLHILSSRTGQVACYTGLAFWGFTYVWKKRKYVLGVGGLIGLLLLPVAAYFAIPSFKTRVEVSRWDYAQYQQGTSASADNSLSARLTTWKACGAVFEHHFWLGVGLEDVGSELKTYYRETGTFEEAPEALTITHNLYLKYAAGGGIATLLYLLLVLLFPLISTSKPMQPLLVGFLIYAATAMMFENILEREIGIAFFTLGYMLLDQTKDFPEGP